MSRPDAPLKNPGELSARLDLSHGRRLLLIDAPPALSELIRGDRGQEAQTSEIAGDAMRSARGRFDAILVWRENRVGSHAILDRAAQQLEDGGVLWWVTALRKVIGPRTPAAHRLELSDLKAGLEKKGLRHDREVRVTAWNVGYRFVKGELK